MFKEFKEFAIRGNVLDLAIGVILGGAFGKIVSSFVTDLLMPPIGLLLGKVDFSNLYINLSSGTYASLAEAKKAGAATWNYGLFINQCVDFTLISFAVFLVVKAVNRVRAAEVTTPAVSTKECSECLSPIPLKASRCAFCTSQVAKS